MDDVVCIEQGLVRITQVLVDICELVFETLDDLCVLDANCGHVAHPPLLGVVVGLLHECNAVGHDHVALRQVRIVRLHVDKRHKFGLDCVSGSLAVLVVLQELIVLRLGSVPLSAGLVRVDIVLVMQDTVLIAEGLVLGEQGVVQVGNGFE